MADSNDNDTEVNPAKSVLLALVEALKEEKVTLKDYNRIYSERTEGLREHAAWLRKQDHIIERSKRFPRIFPRLYIRRLQNILRRMMEQCNRLTEERASVSAVLAAAIKLHIRNITVTKQLIDNPLTYCRITQDIPDLETLNSVITAMRTSLTSLVNQRNELLKSGSMPATPEEAESRRQ